jgi:hypothetical protein
MAPLSARLFGLYGAPMHGLAQAGRAPQPGCKNRHPELRDQQCSDRYVTALDVEWAVWGEVTELLSRSDRLMAMAERYLDARSDQMDAERKQMGNVEQRLQVTERERTNLIRAAAKVGPEAVEDAVQQVDTEIAQLRQSKARVQAWVEANAATAHRRARLWQLAELAHTRLRNPTPELMRRVFDLLDMRGDGVELRHPHRASESVG